jgi:hypothetical protein
VTAREHLTHESFEPHVGTGFMLRAEPEPIVLELTNVTVHPFAGPTRTAFSLFFRGPVDPILEQRTYRLEHTALGPLEIFIVPVDRDESGTEYEAAFN